MGQGGFEVRLARERQLLGEFGKAQAEVHPAIFAFSLPQGKN
jgi:hypothetical protein